MSNYINWRMLIARSRELTFGAKAIGLYLNTFMNDRQDFAWPSIETICGEMGSSKKTVIKYLQELVQKGYLTKEKRFSNSTIYHATIPRSVNSTLLEELHLRSVESTPAVVENLHPNSPLNRQMNSQYMDASTDGERETTTKKRPEKRFEKPTVEQLSEYCEKRSNNVDPQHFWDYYEARGWMLGKGVKMRSWQHAVSVWERNGQKRRGESKSASARFMENLRNA